MTEEKGFAALMQEACVGWGFCGCIKGDKPLHVSDFIPPSGPVRADQFVEWLFLADNVNPNDAPERWQRHKSALHAAFIRHMGAEVVDARMLRYDPDKPPDPRPDRKYRGRLGGA